MKLRNKKTDEIVYVYMMYPDTAQVLENTLTLKELNENWEDYATPEPLIKDEKIRKAVRAWAKINAIKVVEYYIFNSPSSYRFESRIDGDLIAIDFVGWLPELEKEGTYTIAELCGEEDNEN